MVTGASTSPRRQFASHGAPHTRPQMDANGRTWSYNGGHAWGRKFPILFAKTMLNSGWTIPLYHTGGAGEFKFQEDAFTWTDSGTARWGEDCAITPGAFGQDNHNCRTVVGGRDQYELVTVDPSGEGAGPAGLYEISAGKGQWLGIALAARKITGMKTAWGHDDFFDYCDRFVNTEADAMSAAYPLQMSLGNSTQIDFNKYGGVTSGTGQTFATAMWQTYR